jgi:hypothetical protein
MSASVPQSVKSLVPNTLNTRFAYPQSVSGYCLGQRLKTKGQDRSWYAQGVLTQQHERMHGDTMKPNNDMHD